VFGERWIHLGEDTLIGSHVTLSAGMVPGQQMEVPEPKPPKRRARRSRGPIAASRFAASEAPRTNPPSRGRNSDQGPSMFGRYRSPFVRLTKRR
jgi:hypothetical protein